MTQARKRLRDILEGEVCVRPAPIFDPLSARIAEVVGFEVIKLSGSVAKFANLALPDQVNVSNMSDLVDVCRRVTRVVSVSLVVDADEGGGNALVVRRTVRELEAAGASAIEIEDNLVPPHFIAGTRHSLMVSTEEQVGKLRAALAARQDPSLVIVGRTSALSQFPLDEALERVRSYAASGVDALMLPSLSARNAPSLRTDLEAVQQVSPLPLCVSGLPPELGEDQRWLAANRIRLQFSPQLPYRMAVKAIFDALTYLARGQSGEDLAEHLAPSSLLDEISRTAEMRDWDEAYVVPSLGAR